MKSIDDAAYIEKFLLSNRSYSGRRFTCSVEHYKS